MTDKNWRSFDLNEPDNIKKALEIERYLAFFSTIKTLIDNNGIKLKQIDKMFAYRFFTVINNETVVLLLDRKEGYWDDLLDLTEQWVKYRKKLGKNIPKETLFINLQKRLKSRKNLNYDK